MTKQELYVDIVAAVVVDVLVGYLLQKEVEQDKIKKRKDFLEQFNEEYFDFYWTRGIREIDLLAKFFILCLLIFSKIPINVLPADVFGHLIALVSSLIGYVLVSVALPVVGFAALKEMSRDDLDILIDQKGQNYVPYSDSEKERLGKLSQKSSGEEEGSQR